MTSSIHECAVELLLKSIFCDAGNDGLPVGFFYRPPDSSHKGFGTTVYFRQTPLVQAALYVRLHGPCHLRYLALDDICTQLKTFFVNNYWLVSDEVFFKRFPGSFANYLSSGLRGKLAEILALSELFRLCSLFMLNRSDRRLAGSAPG
jgi:hypothetical protein